MPVPGPRVLSYPNQRQARVMRRAYHRRVLCAATCDRLRIMRRAEGTFNLDRFDHEALYDNREGVKLAPAHVRKTFIVPAGGQSSTHDYGR
jgi:hypothetical protein